MAISRDFEPLSKRSKSRADVTEILVIDAVAAQAWRFLNSPTIRIDGLDAEPSARAPDQFGFKCRTYLNGLRQRRRSVRGYASVRAASASELYRLVNVAITTVFAAGCRVPRSWRRCIVRSGLQSHVGVSRLAIIALGGGVLLAYGIFVNLAPADFGRLLGAYALTPLYTRFAASRSTVFQLRAVPRVPRCFSKRRS